MSFKKKLLITTLVTFLLAAGGVTYYFFNLYQEAEKAVTESYQDLERGEHSEQREEEVDPSEDNISILFVGVDDSDTRQGTSSLADALVLATFNKDDLSVNMVSIPRDSYVDVSYQYSKDKINHTHGFGGLDETVSVVEDLLDVPVDYYVRLDFMAFVDTVDALSGIEFDVPYYLEELDSTDEGTVVIHPGEQTLNGEEALAMARTRQHDNDLERGNRQMEILESIIDQTLSFSSITRYNSLIESIGDRMTTNISFSQLVSLHEYVTGNDGLEIEQHQVDGSDLWVNDIYYFDLDERSISDISRELRAHLQIDSQYVEAKENEEEDQGL
ncbi:LCP family protein required for cell wall assembly [Alkalibacillus filiformis]|uniref:LCP family protein required for cell wall assembly n=1 Tax=Alkalibacillus filiformis TaxID=200990 RepID=A0ABU0DWR0_9BACI|nr:LCP family protein [Alkalibacillus filiformis]MDQ0352913.1 LCP family protein required for cell wall assembly [Alkalibacillus filiformis]